RTVAQTAPPALGARAGAMVAAVAAAAAGHRHHVPYRVAADSRLGRQPARGLPRDAADAVHQAHLTARDTGAPHAVAAHGHRRRHRVPRRVLQHRRRGAALRRRHGGRVPRPATRRVEPTGRHRADAGRGLTAGAAWALVPALLKVYAKVDEVVTTLLLNSV